ncbi:hypothetical protein GQ42DRAFT_154262 [Ramicandelaber brevisporus]|nr:hypothetical protein GQ42DRAFT_154262 [Ramicandelaber brevisporus]
MKTAHGQLVSDDKGVIIAKFIAEGHPVEAVLKLAVAPAYPVSGPNAMLEYEDLSALNGPYKIEPGSSIGPDELCLSLLKVGGNGAKVKVKSLIQPPLPVKLSEHGGDVVFNCQ